MKKPKKKKEGPIIQMNADKDVQELTIGEESETFFFSFMGEYVEICGSFYHGNDEAAIKIQGYLLDIDNVYIYLGDTPDEISNAVKKERVIWISVYTPDNEYRRILTDLEVPESDEEKN